MSRAQISEELSWPSMSFAARKFGGNTRQDPPTSSIWGHDEHEFEKQNHHPYQYRLYCLSCHATSTVAGYRHPRTLQLILAGRPSSLYRTKTESLCSVTHSEEDSSLT